eukprot:TRINITY_DN3835_c0_g1_i1.p2 TRINITY_DN3835_c0_g1~~TRINITY_DN3835_c0_g1_i1.p2  ORF type:complete len:192 (-),score=32.29 TRINITY_DN3835_c0_g1_i1:155-730(-)
MNVVWNQLPWIWKAGVLVFVPFTLMFYIYGNLTFNEIIGSILLSIVMFVSVCEIILSYYDIFCRRKARNKIVNLIKKKNEMLAENNVETLIISEDEKGKEKEKEKGDKDAAKPANIDTKNIHLDPRDILFERMNIPRMLIALKRFWPYAMILILGFGNLITVIFAGGITALLFNGRVADMWNRVYLAQKNG